MEKKAGKINNAGKATLEVRGPHLRAGTRFTWKCASQEKGVKRWEQMIRHESTGKEGYVEN